MPCLPSKLEAPWHKESFLLQLTQCNSVILTARVCLGKQSGSRELEAMVSEELEGYGECVVGEERVGHYRAS
jgi:hypothetical protein